MGKFTKRCIAMMLSIIMVFSVGPVNSKAYQTAGTYVKIDTAGELTSGKYVMIVSSGYGISTLDTATSWVLSTALTATGNQVVKPDSSLIWDLDVSGNQVKLTDSNGKSIKPKAANTNGISEGDYMWTPVEENGSFTFNSSPEDMVVLASNKTTGSGDNKFRAYKNSTVNGAPATYITAFTLYKLDDSIPSGPVKTGTPWTSVSPGVVVSGTAITLSCGTPNSSISYSTDNVNWEDYTIPILIYNDMTIYAKATADGCEDSEIAIFDYVISKSIEPDLSLYDPIVTIPDGAMSVLEAIDVASGPAISVTVVGQLVYRFGNYNTTNSAIIQDVIDGQVYGLQIFNDLSDYEIGDIVKLTGTTSVYGSVPQIQAISDSELITPIAETQLISPQEYNSINDLKAVKDDLLSEWVVIKDVTLGQYNSNGNTIVTDSKGNSMPIYRAATYPSGVTEGEIVDLYACVSKYSATDQLRVGTSTDYLITNDTKGPSITLPTFQNGEVEQDYKVSVIIVDNVGVTEAELTYTVDSVPATILLVKSDSDNTKWEGTIPGTVLAKGVSNFTISVTAKDSVGNVTNSDTVLIIVADEPQVVGVTPARNEKTGDNKRPIISITATNVGMDPTAKLSLKTGESVKLDRVSMGYLNGTFSYTPDSNLADGRYTASVVITREDNKSITYEWPFIVGTPEYSLYYGQLHSHTTYSDGSGTLDNALAYINTISEKDNVDFVAFTDHSNYFDKSGAANPEQSMYDASLMTAESQSLWNSYKSKINEFNYSPTNNGVIALAGFEMTWSGGPGHMNTWNTEGIVSRNNTILNNKTNDAGLKAYYELLSQPEGVNSVNQFNHPGTTFGTFSDFGYWDPIIDTRISLVEVGNGEGAIGSGGYFPSYSYYTMALDKGWHVAPSNNQDNHKGKWGNANDARNVIIADNFTEQGIYDALQERRLYSTEDKNLEIHYTVNGELMGSIIQEVPEKLELEVILNDADDMIQKAEVIANSGRVVHTWNVNSQSAELSATLVPDYSYYYIRITQQDGDLAVTAPVWVGRAKMFGISNIESSTSTPVTDEALTIKSTLFNSESIDATIKSISYSLDGKQIYGQTDVGTVSKGTTMPIEYEFIPTKAKVQTFNVEVVMTLEGIDYSFTKDISLDVRDANKLVYVGIDGSHYNEYVAGNYKDSMGNFSLLAAQSNVRCVILNTSEELLAAANNDNGKFKMLVLTAPSRRNGTALRNPYATYSDEEIAAMKGFSEAGGSLVICGWSDLYENYGSFPADDHMAAQQNKLLEAVGASLRISDDGAYDDILNAGGSESNKARLYLTTYNWNNPLTQGIIYDEEHPNDNMYTQRFSQYGGATIYAVDKDGNPTSTLSENVSPIVYGHSSTYSKDCDNDGLGGIGIPKYEYAAGDNRLMVLASETITHANGIQSMVIANGAAFMSNFEIQATISDTNAELNYSNYTILQNLIQYVNPTQIEKIANVQKEVEEGVKYTVEGIVSSNASGFDKSTAFFDCIYLQDETAGINAFPVAGDYKVGQKLRITGTTSSYQGERQLNVTDITLIDSDVIELEPIEVTAQQINDKTYLGSLVKISGTITKVEFANEIVQTILVRDNAGKTARIFIDGYITTEKNMNNLIVGNYITAVGLSSYDNTFDGLAARIRIRDRDDIVCTTRKVPTYPSTPSPSEPLPEIPSENEKTIILVNKSKSDIIKGKANVTIEISEKSLKDSNGTIDIILGEEALKDILTDGKVENGVEIDLKIPAVKDIEIHTIDLSKEALLLAKESGQALTIHITNGESKEYTVHIPVSQLDKVDAKSKALSLSVVLEKDTKAAEKSVGVLSVGTEGPLTTGVEVTIPVKEELLVAAGKKLYIYRKNVKTGKLEEIPHGERVVAKNGTIKLSSLEGGNYVICTSQVKDAVKLVDKARISSKFEVARGKSLTIRMILPNELQQVTTLTKGELVGQEKATVTYKVNNKSIATISNKGVVTGKKKGTVKVTVVVTLANGQKKTLHRNIRIK